MAASVATIDIGELGERIRRVAEVADVSYEPALRQVAVLLASETKQNFESSREPDGRPWKPLKVRKGKPLVDTGLLMASIAAAARSLDTTTPQTPVEVTGGAESQIDITPTSLVFGTRVDYASYHQFGTGRIPAREFLGITDAMVDKIGLIAEDFAEQTIIDALGK